MHKSNKRKAEGPDEPDAKRIKVDCDSPETTTDLHTPSLAAAGLRPSTDSDGRDASSAIPGASSSAEPGVEPSVDHSHTVTPSPTIFNNCRPSTSAKRKADDADNTPSAKRTKLPCDSADTPTNPDLPALAATAVDSTDRNDSGRDACRVGNISRLHDAGSSEQPALEPAVGHSLAVKPAPPGTGASHPLKTEKRKADEPDDVSCTKRIKATDDTNMVDSEGLPAPVGNLNLPEQLPEATNQTISTTIGLAAPVPVLRILIPAEFRNKDAFPFLYLPAEIRLKVYGFLFRLRRAVYPKVASLAGDKKHDTGFRKGRVLSMVLANRRLSAEVTHFIYSQNRFRLSLANHRDWLNTIGRKNASFLQHVIIVGSGRPKLAARELYAMLATLWKRSNANLRSITVHDEWHSLHSNFVVKQLLDFGVKRSWNHFRKLETIGVDVPHKVEPVADKPLYEKLCLQSRAAVTARHEVGAWKTPLVQGPEGWHTAGVVWLNLRLALAEREKQLEKNRAERKKLAQLRKKEKRKKEMAERAKARAEAQWKRQQERKQQVDNMALD